jgi:hypothetical protein
MKGGVLACVYAVVPCLATEAISVTLPNNSYLTTYTKLPFNGSCWALLYPTKISIYQSKHLTIYHFIGECKSLDWILN